MRSHLSDAHDIHAERCAVFTQLGDEQEFDDCDGDWLDGEHRRALRFRGCAMLRRRRQWRPRQCSSLGMHSLYLEVLEEQRGIVIRRAMARTAVQRANADADQHETIKRRRGRGG